jgi:hypothetical protein
MNVGGICFSPAENFIFKVRALSSSIRVLASLNHTALLHYEKNIINVELSNHKYFVSGGDTPTTRIDYYMGFSGEMTITVNGKFAPFNNELDLYFWFRADPGDQFTVGVYYNPARRGVLLV